MKHRSKALLLFVVTASVTASGCYAKKKDVLAEFALVRKEMQQADQDFEGKYSRALVSTEQRLGGRIDAVSREVQRLSAQLGDLNVKVTSLNGLIAFDMPVHFEFGQAQLRDSDRAVLKRFAAVVKEFYPAALITAEGYTDPAGSRASNLRLGKKRADAVRAYLTAEGGISSQQVRTVSYGEASNRLVDRKSKGPGETGLPNRRVVLVFDYVGTAVALTARGINQ